MTTYDEDLRLERQRQLAVRDAKRKLNRAFRRLRGYSNLVAKQNYWCCTGCASANIAESRASNSWGYVFYTKQTGFIRDDGSKKVRKLVLNFGTFGYDRRQAAIGRLVKEALEECGLHIEWDGSPGTSITVDPCPGLWGKGSSKPALTKTRKVRVPTRFERVAQP